MSLMQWRIGLTQVLSVGMLLLAGCGDSSKDGRDGGDGGLDGRRDGLGLEVGDGGEVGDGATADLGPDAITDAGPGDTASEVGGETGADAPFIGDGGIDAPADGAADVPQGGDAARDLGDAGPLALIASLGGDEETPPVSTTATGTASFVLDPGMTSLSYRLVHTLVGVTDAHIHLGGGNEAGPVLFTLSPLSSDMTGTVTLTPTQASELLAGRMYVNLHSAAQPAGEIRGQILMPGETMFLATLTGEQETPPSETTGTGTASVILSAGKDSIKYHLQTSLTPTGAHIHKAIGGLSGPVAIPFAPLGQTIHGVSAITPAQAIDLAEGRMYANVHTSAYPNGEIRGQLLLPGERLATAILSGANETPPVTTTATGAVAFILSYAQDTMRYEGVFTDLSGPATMARLEGGIVGDAGTTSYPLTLVVPDARGIKGVQAVLPTDVAALRATPPGMFVNVHTIANPNGEIGGPLLLQQ